MTFRELAEKERPELINPDEIGGVIGCPSDYGYESLDENLCFKENRIAGNGECRRCWDREIPVKDNKSEWNTINNDKNNESEKTIMEDNKNKSGIGLMDYFGTKLKFIANEVVINHNADSIPTIEIKAHLTEVNNIEVSLINDRSEK